MRPKQFEPLSLRFLICAALICAVCLLSGCSYMNFAARKAHWGITFKGIPSMSTLNNLAPEDSLIVGGQIIKPRNRQEPLLLLAVSNQYRKNETVATIQIQQPNELYMIFLPKGDYDLYVFADLDKSKDFETDEVVGRASVHVDPAQSISGALQEGPSITLNMDHPGSAAFHVRERVKPSSYVYASLDDDLFDPSNGKTGLYYPTELIYYIQGFVFGLEEYDPGKTTVLFIHGIAGTPRDWKFLAAGLDRTRYQPFFFYYPSGLQLDKLGTLLAETLNYIGNNNSIRHPRKIIVVAHSMGGLVALSAINKLTQRDLPSYLKMYCSFSTPYGGSDIAQEWAGKAPAKIPAWLDVQSQSNFVQTLNGKPIPGRLPFYLFFSYKTPSTIKQPENSDGAVSIRSQLELGLQTSATRVIGFNETHMGILNSEPARTIFLKTLDEVISANNNIAAE